MSSPKQKEKPNQKIKRLEKQLGDDLLKSKILKYLIEAYNNEFEVY